jgi:large subunit ribosomal protein L25
MEKLLLQKRDVLGKKSKHLINEGFLPGVMYNSKGESTNIKLTNSDASWLYRNTTSTTILDTELEGKKYKTVVKEFDIHPLTGNLIHLSLFEIDEKAPMVFTIPFTIVGISPAVKNNLGILVKALDSIDVRCTLEDLVPDITVDVSKLDHIGQTISVDEIKLPKGITLINKDIENAAIITITELQKAERLETAEETEEGIEGEEVAEGEEGEVPQEGAEEKPKEE